MYDSGDIKENKGTGEWECVREVYGGKSVREGASSNASLNSVDANANQYQIRLEVVILGLHPPPL